MTKSIMKPVRIPPDLLAKAENYMAEYGFATWSDFVRTAIDEFCDSLKHARLGWQPPTASDKVDHPLEVNDDED